MTADPDEGQPAPVTDGPQLIAGRYRLVSEVGSGAMGVVWRARDETLGRDVAVKELRPDIGMSGAQVRQSHQRARREGRIAARLQHPNAVTIYDVAEHAGRPYLIMEFVPSSSLADILAAGTVLTPAETARIGTQLASALAAAHGVGIVHRDIKPGNVLMTADGTVKLTDFGISRATGDATVTATGEILGTPAYTAPEVAQGHAVDSPADVFSLGATLYAAVEGGPPFGDEVNAMAVLLRVVRNELRPPKRAGILTDSVLAMLSPDPADRPTMREVWQGLDALVATLPPLPGTAGVAAAGPASAAKRRGRIKATAMLPEIEAAAGDAVAAGAAAGEVAAGELAAGEVPAGAGSVGVEAAAASAAEPGSDAEQIAAADAGGAVLGPEAVGAETAAADSAGGGAVEAAGSTAVGAASVPPPTTDVSTAAAHTERDLPRVQNRRRVLIGGSVGGTVAVVAGIVVALSGGGKPATTPAAAPVGHPPTSAASQSAAKPPASPVPTPPKSAAATSAATSATTAPATVPTAPTPAATTPTGDVAGQLTAAISDYYQLVPGNLQQAWTRLTAGYQQNKARGFANYQSFWQGMQRVTASNVVAQGPDTVVATIDYYPTSGSPSEERTSFTLVDEGGVWKIASSSVLSSKGL